MNLPGTNSACECCQRTWPRLFFGKSLDELLTGFTRTTGSYRHLQVRKLEAFLSIFFCTGSSSTKHLFTSQVGTFSLLQLSKVQHCMMQPKQRVSPNAPTSRISQSYSCPTYSLPLCRGRLRKRQVSSPDSEGSGRLSPARWLPRG